MTQNSMIIGMHKKELIVPFFIGILGLNKLIILYINKE